MIHATALTRDYESLRALDSLDLAVGAGEVLGLVGANGAGKTTCLQCLAGIMPPTSGQVTINGVSLRDDPRAAKRWIAFIPDTPQLFEYLTVREHMLLIARVYGLRDWEPRAAALLEEFEIAEKADALPNELSRGMKQKAAICQAFLPEPRVILCDEPLSGLDPLGRRSMREALLARARSGAALIVSSHQLDLVSAMSDRILILDRGKHLLEGTLAEIQRALPSLDGNASLEEVFLAAVSGAGALDPARRAAPASARVDAPPPAAPAEPPE
ncbi:MAG: ABC transporter ATP-binding protein [Planctomycetes bacterium]|nr:ABC transporter ATP-binding protein [Planctomycetota bacterium]